MCVPTGSLCLLIHLVHAEDVAILPHDPAGIFFAVLPIDQRHGDALGAPGGREDVAHRRIERQRPGAAMRENQRQQDLIAQCR